MCVCDYLFYISMLYILYCCTSHSIRYPGKMYSWHDTKVGALSAL